LTDAAQKAADDAARISNGQARVISPNLGVISDDEERVISPNLGIVTSHDHPVDDDEDIKSKASNMSAKSRHTKYPHSHRNDNEAVDGHGDTGEEKENHDLSDAVEQNGK